MWKQWEWLSVLSKGWKIGGVALNRDFVNFQFHPSNSPFNGLCPIHLMPLKTFETPLVTWGKIISYSFYSEVNHNDSDSQLQVYELIRNEAPSEPAENH